MSQFNHPIVGKVSYTPLGGGRISLPSAWVSSHVGTVLIPELKGVPTYEGKKFSGNVRFHKAAIPQLKAAFAEVGRLGLASKILFWDGSFVQRLKREGGTVSEHGVALAFDINANWNPFKKPPAPKGAKGSVLDLVPIFKDFGFECGAEWKVTPDGMHFQVKRILSPQEIEILTRNHSVYDTPASDAPISKGSIVVSVEKNGQWTDTRINTLVQRDSNHPPIQRFMEIAGIPFTVSTWGDGTPNIRITNINQS